MESSPHVNHMSTPRRRHVNGGTVSDSAASPNGNDTVMMVGSPSSSAATAVETASSSSPNGRQTTASLAIASTPQPSSAAFDKKHSTTTNTSAAASPAGNHGDDASAADHQTSSSSAADNMAVTEDTAPYVSDVEYYTTLAIDALFWFAIFFREYFVPDGAASQNREHYFHYQCAIAHFVAVVPMSDFIVFWLPRRFVRWYNLFRITSTLQVGALTFQLWWVSNTAAGEYIDGPQWLTFIRLSLCALRFFHAIRLVPAQFNKSGGWPSIWKTAVRTGSGIPLLAEWKDIFAYCTSVKGPNSTDFLAGILFILLAHVFRCTHFTFGEVKLDGPLTGFQAGDSINLFFKAFFFDRFLGNQYRLRALFYFVMFLVLFIQWPIMPVMFSKAPFPFIHIGAEMGLLSSCVARLRFHYYPRN